MPAKIQVSNDQLLLWRRQYEKDLMAISAIARNAGLATNTVRDRLLSIGVEMNKSPRLSIKAKGRPSPRKGYKFTDAERKAVGERSKGNKWCVGRKLSDESRKRMSAAMLLRRERWVAEGRIDPEYSLAVSSQRERFKRLLKSILRAAKTKKRASTALSVGYSRATLVEHIEKQFEPGMSWLDTKSFSIDHIIPVADFIKRGVSDPKIVNSLANLRPMHPKLNRIKSDKYDGDFDADLAKIIAFNDSDARRQVLTAHFGQGGTTYTEGV